MIAKRLVFDRTFSLPFHLEMLFPKVHSCVLGRNGVEVGRGGKTEMEGGRGREKDGEREGAKEAV